MLTIFSIPKSFNGHSNITQRNAIQSWTLLRPKCEIILFGDDEGVAEAAAEFGALHVPGVKKNECGTPLLDSAFNLAQKLAKNNTLVYVNADIILMSDFIPAIQKIKKQLFLMSGRRWDLDIKEEIDFDDPDWENKLRNLISRNGKLHGLSGMDYFIFPRNLQLSLPSFAVGRPGWDNWLIYNTRSLKIPVIDATEAITIIHQNHDYSHSPFGRKAKVDGPELQQNIKLAGGSVNMCTLRDADWVLTKEELRKSKFPRRIFTILSLFYPWRFLLSIKRRLQR